MWVPLPPGIPAPTLPGPARGGCRDLEELRETEAPHSGREAPADIFRRPFDFSGPRSPAGAPRMAAFEGEGNAAL